MKGRAFSKILVFSAAGIGDTLTDSVAIRALKESFPRARLTVVTHRRRATLAQHNHCADEVVLYHKSFLRFISLARELRARRFEAVIMLRGNDPDLWPLAWLANRHAVVSCPIMTRFKFLISHPVHVPAWDQTHGVEQTLEVVRSLGADTTDRRLVYQVREEERAALRQKMIFWGIEDSPKWREDKLGRDGVLAVQPPRTEEDAGDGVPPKHRRRKPSAKPYLRAIQDSPLIVFQVGGGQRSGWRDWPVEHYVKLGKRLLDQYDVQLVLLGGADLCARAAAIDAALPRAIFPSTGFPPGAINLAGKLSLAESAALLSLAKILVSTDTGIMHLGFAVGVDTLALIHCNNPASRVGPHGYGDKHRVVQLEPPPGVAISKDVDMALVTPEAVWPQLEQLCDRNKLQRVV